MTVLDIGCNAGFYSMEMKRRGADRVLGIDTDARYLRQARFAAEVNGMDVEFRQMAVWDVAKLGREVRSRHLYGRAVSPAASIAGAGSDSRARCERSVVVPEHAARQPRSIQIEDDYDFNAPAPFDAPGYPKMHFIEQRYSHDETNWWVPNRACVEAMLRSSGFTIEAQPEDEVYLCRWKPVAFLRTDHIACTQRKATSECDLLSAPAIRWLWRKSC